MSAQLFRYIHSGSGETFFLQQEEGSSNWELNKSSSKTEGLETVEMFNSLEDAQRTLKKLNCLKVTQ